MSESESFIREVTEEVRQDRMFRLWKRYGPLVIGGLALIVAASAAWNWMQHRAREEARELGGALLAAGGTPEALAAVAAGLSGPARAVADLRLAAAQVAAGDTPAAIATYRRVAATPGLKRAYADLAALEAARLEAPLRPAGEIEAALAPLVEPGAPYRALALELRAVTRLNAGRSGEARADLETILAEPGLTRGLNARALQLLAILGERAAAD